MTVTVVVDFKRICTAQIFSHTGRRIHKKEFWRGRNQRAQAAALELQPVLAVIALKQSNATVRVDFDVADVGDLKLRPRTGVSFQPLTYAQSPLVVDAFGTNSGGAPKTGDPPAGNLPRAGHLVDMRSSQKKNACTHCQNNRGGKGKWLEELKTSRWRRIFTESGSDAWPDRARSGV